MTEAAMVLLTGEQPIPNLLGVRHVDPASVLLVESERTKTVGDRLVGLLGRRVERLLVKDPYDLVAVQECISDRLQKLGWADQVVFNLTGGTKLMALAAYSLAQRLERPWIYVRSEGGRSLIYRYNSDGEPIGRPEEAASLITVDDYLRAHLGKYDTGAKPGAQDEEQAGKWFEDLVARELRGWSYLDEVIANVRYGEALELDLVLRKGNQVGVAELKSGTEAYHKKGIDQLSTATEQRYLGTYTRRFLIIDRPLGPDLRDLAEQHRIRVIQLKLDQRGHLLEPSRQEFREAVRTWMGKQG